MQHLQCESVCFRDLNCFKICGVELIPRVERLELLERFELCNVLNVLNDLTSFGMVAAKSVNKAANCKTSLQCR
jgi:hypothetical protein